MFHAKVGKSDIIVRVIQFALEGSFGSTLFIDEYEGPCEIQN